MGLAGAGAGASEGLDVFLNRMLVQQEMARRTAAEGETIRHNRATEDNTRAGQLLLEKERDDTNQRLTTNATIAHADSRAIGDVVTPAEMTRETAAGIPSSRYGVLKGLKATQTSGGAAPVSGLESSLEGRSAGPTADVPDVLQTKQTQGPDSILNRGTEAQQVVRQNLDDKEYKQNADLTVARQRLEDAATRLEMQGKLNEANILRAHAQAALDDTRREHVGDAKPLPASTADNMAGLNVAEVEGVKVLKALKEGGLENSNDPLDPRWQKFMVTTLKMAPADWAKADIQQRTAAVNAMLTRGLMGARPSQYVAQLIQQHLPQGDMTPAQLKHVITNVLEQAGERRDEIESLTGRQPGDLKPKSGQSYRDYLSEAQGGGGGVPTGGGGGVPTVGGTFNGGTVLRVTPVR